MKYLNWLILVVPLLLGMVNFNNSNNINYRGIYYDNFSYSDNVIFKGSDGENIDYSAQLEKVGDYYDLSFDIINDTDVDVKVTDCVYNKEDPYIEYELLYSNGKEIKKGDILKSGDSIGVKYHVLYKNQIKEMSYDIDSGFSISYDQVI